MLMLMLRLRRRLQRLGLSSVGVLEGRIGGDHDLRVNHRFPIRIGGGILRRVIVQQLLRLDGLLRREIGGLLQVLRRILSVVGRWIAHRPRTPMTVINQTLRRRVMREEQARCWDGVLAMLSGDGSPRAFFPFALRLGETQGGEIKYHPKYILYMYMTLQVQDK